MDMKRFLITLAAAVIVTMAANAEEKTKTYNFGDITRLSASITYEVHVTEGNSGKVTVVYESDYERHLRIKYDKKESRLDLHMNDIPKKYKKGLQPHVDVYIEMDKIDHITTSGGAEVHFAGHFHAGQLDISCMGASEIDGLDITAEHLSATLSGASKAEISGIVSDDTEFDISGASSLRFRMDTDEQDAESSGASKIDGFGNITQCRLECSGAAKVCLEGKGDYLDAQCSGASSIDARKYIVRAAEIELSGASGAKVNATEEIRHNVSRASKMTYYGNAVLIDINESSNIVRGDR